MKLSSLALLLSCCWISAACTATFEVELAFEEEGSFEKMEYQAPSGRTLPYMSMEPAVMEAGEDYPLVLVLHGVGGRGQVDWAKNCYANAVLMKPAMRAEHPCFVIAPTVGLEESWRGQPLLDVFDLLEELMGELPIDSERVYITGQSMGGFGTYQALIERPQLFAAAAPVCGWNEPSKAETISHIPLWAFHGTDDLVVPVSGSQEMVEALREAGGSPKYTELPGVKHDAWNQAYDSVELWAWLFSQLR